MISPLSGVSFKLSDCVQTGDVQNSQNSFDLNIPIKTRDDIFAEFYYDFESEEKVMQLRNGY